MVSTPNAPGAVGPYSQAIKANGMVYVSGQVGLVPGVSAAARGTHCAALLVGLPSFKYPAFLKPSPTLAAPRNPPRSPHPLQTKDFASGGVEGQAEQVMANLGAILAASGSSWDKVVKTTILLVDMGDFATVNAVYGESDARRGRTPRVWVGGQRGPPPHGRSHLHPLNPLLPVPRGGAGKYFPVDPPARATFAVKGLPLGALVEIEATALL